MSLINKMLQDLDARQVAQGGGVNLPNDVRPLPVQRRSGGPWLLAGVVLLFLLGAVGYFASRRELAAAPELVPSAQAESPRPEEVVAPPVTKSAAPVAPAGEVAPSPGGLASEGGLRLANALSARPDKAGVARERATLREEGGKNIPAQRTLTEKQDGDAKASPGSIAGTVSPAEVRTGGSSSIEKSDPESRPRDRAESGYRKALSVLNQGRIGEALDMLQEVLHTNSLHVASRQLLVKLLLEARRLDEVVRVLQEGVQGQPAQTGWAMTLARLQVDRGDLSGAGETLQHSLPAAAANPDYQGFLAHLLQRQGRNREAADLYRAAARLVPGDGRWWLGLGLALEGDGHADQALAAFQRARQSGNLNHDLMALVEQKLQR